MRDIVHGYVIDTREIYNNEYETMVFPCDCDGFITSYAEVDCARYNDMASAEAGHKSMIEKWNSI